MTAEIALTLAVLLATVLLFVFEVLRVDVIALLVMLALAWLKLVTPAQAFSGLAGTAVVSMIAVMIMGAGIDRSGVFHGFRRHEVRRADHGLASLALAADAPRRLAGGPRRTGRAEARRRWSKCCSRG